MGGPYEYVGEGRTLVLGDGGRAAPVGVVEGLAGGGEITVARRGGVDRRELFKS